MRGIERCLQAAQTRGLCIYKAEYAPKSDPLTFKG